MNVADFGVFNTSNLIFFKEHPLLSKTGIILSPPSSCQLPPLFCSSLSAPKALRVCRCPWTISKLLFFDDIMQIDSDNVIGYLNVWSAAMLSLYNAWRKGHNRKMSVGVLKCLSLSLSLSFFFNFSSHKRKTGVGFCPLSHFLANRNKSPGLCNSVVKEERLLWESPRAFDGRERIKSYVFN